MLKWTAKGNGENMTTTVYGNYLLQWAKDLTGKECLYHASWSRRASLCCQNIMISLAGKDCLCRSGIGICHRYILMFLDYIPTYAQRHGTCALDRDMHSRNIGIYRRHIPIPIGRLNVPGLWKHLYLQYNPHRGQQATNASQYSQWHITGFKCQWKYWNTNNNSSAVFSVSTPTGWKIPVQKQKHLYSIWKLSHKQIPKSYGTCVSYISKCIPCSLHIHTHKSSS